MTEFPGELIVEILLLLPVVPLLRFRCVSKKWCNLIDSPDFVKSHLDLSNKAHSMMIFCEKTCAYYADFDSVCNDSAPPVLKELTKPWRGNACKFFGVGHCNGLLCIYTIDFGVFVWNPSTRKHVQVPCSDLRGQRFISWVFGYDGNSDDYKVVSIECSKVETDGSARFIVWVYSLKSGSWKSIGDLPYVLGFRQPGLPHLLLGFRQRGVFVSGALHWRVHLCSERDGSNLIVALDLGKLEYNLVPQPDYRDNNINMYLRLGVLDGCLCVISYDYRSHGFDFWVMKEYGVKESWTRLITCTGNPITLTPLAYTENGNELLCVTNSNV